MSTSENEKESEAVSASLSDHPEPRQISEDLGAEMNGTQNEGGSTSSVDIQKKELNPETDVETNIDARPELPQVNPIQDLSRKDTLMPEQMRESLNNAVEQGINQYKILLNELADSKVTYTTKQIQQHQQKAREEVLEAFTETYYDLLNPVDPALFTSAKEKLTETLDSPKYMHECLLRYDHAIANVLKDLQSCTIEAENIYEAQMEEFIPNQKSKEEVEQKHNQAVEAAMKAFSEMLQEKNLILDDEFCRKEIDWKLKENLELLQHNWLLSCPDVVLSTEASEPIQGQINSSGSSAQSPNREINLAAFLDEKHISVWVINADKKEGSKIYERPLEFDAGTNPDSSSNENVFSIYRLMTERQLACHMVHDGPSSKIISTDDILTRFFKHLLSKIASSVTSTLDSPVDNKFNLVMASAFPLTSYQKERSFIAASKAQFRKVRLISSTTATAAKFFEEMKEKEENGSLLRTETRKQIIVIHPRDFSFSMSAVEIGSTVIESKAFFGSINDRKLQDVSFMQSHCVVFRNKAIEGDEDFLSVVEAYSKAKDCLLKSCNLELGGISTVVVAGSFKEHSLLEHLLQKVFSKKIHELPSGPMEGAILIASMTLSSYGLKVNDHAGSAFKVYVNKQDGEESEVEILELKVDDRRELQLQTERSVTVWEVLLSGEAVPACKYSVTGKPTKGNCFAAELSPKINQDGVYGIFFDISNARKGSLVDQHCMHDLGQSGNGLLYLPYVYHGDGPRRYTGLGALWRTFFGWK